MSPHRRIVVGVGNQGWQSGRHIDYSDAMKRWGLLVSIVAWALGGAACGDDGNNKGHLADAPPGIKDAPDDAAAALQPVTIVVTVQGQPQKDVQVHFQNADSTVVASTKTGDDGKASTLMDAGGFVTVIEPNVGQEGSGSGSVGPTEIATFAGVKPGDVLHDDIIPLNQEQTSVGLTFSVPDEGLNHVYWAYTSCSDELFIGSGTGPVEAAKAKARKLGARAAALEPIVGTVSLTGCKDNTADILILAREPSEGPGRITGWQYKSAVAVGDDTTVTFDGAYQPAVDTQFNYTKVPASINSFDVTRELHTARGSLFHASSFAEVVEGTGNTTITMPAPQGVAMLTTSSGQSNAMGRPTIVEWGAALPTYNLAYGDLALSEYTTYPSVDVDTHTMTWEAQAGVNADFVLARYTNNRLDQQEARRFWTWRIVAPYTASKIVFPVLPVADGEFDFNLKTETDNPFVQRLTTAKLPGGYDVARAYALNVGYYNSDYALPSQLGLSGQTIYQDLNQQRVGTGPATVTKSTKKSVSAAPKRLSPASH